MISYLIKGKMGNITDPRALLIFYARIWRTQCPPITRPKRK